MPGSWIVIVTVGILVAALRKKLRRNAAWRRAAVELGLGFDESFFSPPRLRGRVRGYEVTVDVENDRAGKGVSVRVGGRGLLPSELLLTREGWGSRLVRSIRGGEDLVTGDPLFDREVFVQGPSADTLARLDARARRHIRTALAVPMTKVEGGQIVREKDLGGTSDIVRQVEELVSLAECLRLTQEVPDKLAHNVEHEVMPEVRLSNLRRLQSMPSHPAAERASRAACEDADPRLRLEGALHLGEDGFTILAALVDTADGGSHRSPRPAMGLPVRIQALRHLVQRFDAARVAPIIRRQLQIGTPRLLEVAIEGVGALRLASLLPDLRAKIPEADEAVALAILEAVTRIADETVEADLLQLLDHGSPRVQERSAAALGTHGTVYAIPALRESVAGSSTRAFRRTVQRAIQSIQERLEGAEPGQLAVANDATARAGALSLAPSAGGGELALAEEGPFLGPDLTQPHRGADRGDPSSSAGTRATGAQTASTKQARTRRSGRVTIPPRKRSRSRDRFCLPPRPPKSAGGESPTATSSSTPSTSSTSSTSALKR